MKTFLWAATLGLVASGCSQPNADQGAAPKSQASAPVTSAVPTSATPGATAPAAAAPAGTPPVCEAEIALSCPDSFVDGCVGKVTTRHACVPRGATAMAAGCRDDIVLTCPSGQRDACDSPVVSDHHVCVLKR